MDEKKSLEQISHEYYMKICETRGKILDDFFIAYAAQLSHLGKDFSLDDLCIVEQHCTLLDGKMGTKYWFEYKPKFKD